MKRNLFLVGLVLLTAVTLVGCSQSSPTAPKQPTPSTFAISLTVSPNVAGINERIIAVARVTVGGANAPDGTKVEFAAVGSASFSQTALVQTGFATTTGGTAAVNVYSLAGGAGMITATVPNASASAQVRFTGGSASQAAIFSVLPNRASPTGGTQVVIGGQGLLMPQSVKFVVGGNSYQAAISSVAADGSSITVATPQLPNPSASDVNADIQVTLATGTVVTFSAGFTFTASTGTPLLYNVAPATGSASGGDLVALTGKYFTEPIEVDFVYTDPNGGVSRNVAARVVDVQHGSDGTDTAHIQTPRASTGTVSQTIPVDLTIKNLVGGNSLSNTFPRAFAFVPDVTTPPTIFYISPTYGSTAGNDTVTIYGKNFVQPATVQIGTVNEQVQSVSADGTTITILTRPLAGTPPAEAQTVTVTTSLGVATLPAAFTYLEGQTPQLYVLTPNLGPLEGGTRVTITGTGFQYPVQVTFSVGSSNYQAQVVSNNYNQVVCISPSITAGQPGTPTTASVTVTNTGTGKTSGSLPFTYGQAMFISSVAPSTGPDTGGTQVTIFGQGFTSPASVSLAGTPAQVLSVAGTQIVATTGAVVARSCSPITGSVTVTNIDSGASATGGSWTYTPKNPQITGVASTCTNGASTGCTITVTGLKFEPGMRIVFTNPAMALPTTFVSATQITGTVTTSFETAGIAYRTIPCGTNGGVQKVPTAIDVQVLNTSNNCTDTLAAALTVTPSDTSCVAPPVAATVTVTPTAATVSVAAGLPKTLAFTVTVTPAAAVSVSLSYAGSFVFSPAGPASITTNSSGVGSFSVTVPNTVKSGDAATIIASYGSAVSQPATVTITP